MIRNYLSCHRDDSERRKSVSSCSRPKIKLLMLSIVVAAADEIKFYLPCSLFSQRLRVQIFLEEFKTFFSADDFKSPREPNSK